MEMEERLGEDFRDGWIAETTGAVAIVEEVFEGEGEASIELGLGLSSAGLWVGIEPGFACFR